MCTVSVVRYPESIDPSALAGAWRDEVDVIRMVVNRDEQRSRPEAEPPGIRQFGDRRAVLPIDPPTGGTWVAVNDAGLAATLLNVYPHRPHRLPLRMDIPGQFRSRGEIIPSLMHCGDAASAAARASALDPEDYPPFQLVLLDRQALISLRSDGRRWTCEESALDAWPRMFTSSGLGDAVVEPPRRKLFEWMFANDTDLAGRQDAFHRHSWRDRAHLSVCMSRAEARTVSLTVIEIRPASVYLGYYPVPPVEPGSPPRPVGSPSGAAMIATPAELSSGLEPLLV